VLEPASPLLYSMVTVGAPGARFERMGNRGHAALAAMILTWASACAAETPWQAPRATDGRPDLSGLWSTTSLTRLQRPAELDSLVLTDEQARAYEADRAKRREARQAPGQPGDPAPPAGGDVQGASEWNEVGPLARIDGKARSSWIVDPANGQIPYSEDTRREAALADDSEDLNFKGPETRPYDERCLLGVGSPAGPPILNSSYNNLVQIVQTPQAVALVFEMNHDARIVRLDGSGHLPAQVRPWMGDSIGRWEGETLVVETTNFHPSERWRWTIGGRMIYSARAKVTERFTRVGPDRILYRFEIDDPESYTQVWRGEMPMVADKGPMFEFACHEGNRSLPGILRGARREEQAGLPAK
jgi:hypothetical protein